MTTLTRWLLRALADNWPVTGAGTYAGDHGQLLQASDPGGPLFLEDRDDSVVIQVDTTTDPTTLTRDRPRKDFDESAGNTLGVALTGASETPAGLGGREYRNEPTLSVRVQGTSEYYSGHITDADEFEDDLVRTALDVVEQIDNGTLQKAPVSDFYVADPGTQNPDMSGSVSHYSWQFDVEPRGYQQL